MTHNMEPVGQKISVGEIPSLVAKMDAGMDELLSIIHDLSSRMEPIMLRRDMIPQVAQTLSDSSIPVSPLGEELTSILNRLGTARDALVVIAKRLQI